MPIIIEWFEADVIAFIYHNPDGKDKLMVITTKKSKVIKF